MGKMFRITVEVFTIATVILAIAIAYVFGEMRGVLSQRPLIKELMEELNGLITDFGLWVHPLWYPLLVIAFILGACWIVIVVIALTGKKKEQT